MRNKGRVFSLICVLLTFGTLFGQNTKATLAGVVKDTSGAFLQGARVTLERAAQPTASNSQGAFFFTNLAPGTYKVTVSFVGFESYSKEVTLSAGQTTQVAAVLDVASASDH